MIKRLLTLSIVLSSVQSLVSQEIMSPKKNSIIEQRIEMIAEQNDSEDLDYITLMDELNNYYEHPLALNHATKEELEQLQLLTDYQIVNLLDHISKNGKLIAIYELQSIDGFDMGSIQTILPFVKVDRDFQTPNISFKEMMKNSSNELYVRWSRILEKQEGYRPIEDSVLEKSPNKRYLGSPDKIYTRYRFKYSNNISIGLTGEKDEGEQFFKETQKNGYDFYSAHFYLRDFGMIKQIAIGDYQTQFGQGLTLMSGIGFGKSAYVMNLKRAQVPIKPFTSVNENQFMRGIATTIALKKFEITGFYSSKKIDASIISSQDTANNAIDDGIVEVSSLLISGLHTTPAELKNKNAITETYYGGHIAYKTKRLNLGITGLQYEFDAMLYRSVKPYSQFRFNDNKTMNFGVDYDYLFSNFSFFGEISRSQNGGTAMLHGVLASIDPRVSLIAVYRKYERNYHYAGSTFAAFAEGPGPNEEGTYLGMILKPVPTWTFSAYFDKFKFPWLTSQTDAPSNGIDYLGQLVYNPSKKVEIYFRYRNKIKESNSPEKMQGVDFLSVNSKEIIRLNASYKISETVKLKNRVEYIVWKEKGKSAENGFLVYQDVIYDPLSFPFSFTFRYGLFDTESYNSRIYAYENDVLYSYSIPAYYYRGMRTQLTVRYSPIRNIDIWIRYAQSYYDNRRTIGSGLNEIDGNSKSQVRVQVRLKF